MNINLSEKTDIEKLRNSKTGTKLNLNGKIYTARDAAHKKIVDLTKNNKDLPISLIDSIIYYMGPTPARKGFPIGSCGPTSSYRMDDFLESTLKLGVIATIGKGERQNFVDTLTAKYKAPYLVTIGGAAAYLAKCVISSNVVLFDELGAEAVRELEVKNFPVIVASDIFGNNIFNKK